MNSFVLEQRRGAAPITGEQPPQLQFSGTSPREIYQAMAAWFFTSFDHTREEPIRISVPSSRALWLDERIDADPEAFMPSPGSREFTHLHKDGSLHLVLSERDEGEVTAKEWGLHHPWKNAGVNEILVYAPRDLEEVELLKPVIEASYKFAMSRHQSKQPSGA